MTPNWIDYELAESYLTFQQVLEFLLVEWSPCVPLSFIGYASTFDTSMQALQYWKNSMIVDDVSSSPRLRTIASCVTMPCHGPMIASRGDSWRGCDSKGVTRRARVIRNHRVSSGEAQIVAALDPHS